MKCQPPRLSAQPGTRLSRGDKNPRNLVGNKLQSFRKRFWLADPHCKSCGKLTQFPYGFALDHITPLAAGGTDAPENLQILCHTCHDMKSEMENVDRGDGR